MSGIQFTVTLDEAEVDAIIQRATEEVRTLAAKSLTAQLIAPMVKERIVPRATERPTEQEGVPVITWDAFHARIKGQSVITAALLAQKSSILRYHVNSHLHLRMSKPIAEQFTRQQSKANLLIRVAREFLGEETSVTIYTGDSEWYDLQYAEPQTSTKPTQSAMVSWEDTVIICAIFSTLQDKGEWNFKPEKIITDKNGNWTIVKSVKYCCVKKDDGQKATPLFWLPRTPGLCYLDPKAPIIKEFLEPHPIRMRKRWRQVGLLDASSSNTTTKTMSVYGKIKRLIPLKLEALNAIGVDTSWACEP